MALNQNGKDLFEVLRSGLSRLELVVDNIRDSQGVPSVSISAGSGFVAYWLIPRLPEIEAAFPDINIHIISHTHNDDGQDNVGDIQIRFGNGQWPSYAAHKILGEEVFPVASPFYLEKVGVPQNTDDLAKLRLLGMPRKSGAWYDWTHWFADVAETAPPKFKSIEFDNYALITNAGLAAQGTFLCWAGLLDDFIDAGSLVRLTSLSASSSRGYFVTGRKDMDQDSADYAILSWIADRH